MNHFKSLILLIAVSAFMYSCKGGGADAATTAAKMTCKCTQPLIEINKQVTAARDANDTEKLTALMGDLATKQEGMTGCIKELEEKFGDKDGDKEFEAAMKAAMKKECPDVYEMMNQFGG